jgi:hypothetical protein
MVVTMVIVVMVMVMVVTAMVVVSVLSARPGRGPAGHLSDESQECFGVLVVDGGDAVGRGADAPVLQDLDLHVVLFHGGPQKRRCAW